MSVLNVKNGNDGNTEESDCMRYFICFQWFTNGLCAYITDLIGIEAKRCECLYLMWKMGMRRTRKRVIVCVTLFVSNDLPMDCAPASPIWLEQRLSDVSVCIWCVSYKSWKQKRVIVCVTLFVSSALPIDCAPASPIWLEERSSDLSVCVRCERREWW